MVPVSYPNLPEGLVQRCFEYITDREIEAPATRSMIKGAFDYYEMQSELRMRLLNAKPYQDPQMTAEEFLSTTDLSNP